MGPGAVSVHAGELIDLRAGPVPMIFERSTGFLSYLRTDGYEIVHGIHAVARNPARTRLRRLRTTPGQLARESSQLGIALVMIC